MVIRLFRRHLVLACVCILAVAVAVTRAVNYNRSEPAAQAGLPVSQGDPPSASAPAESPASSSGASGEMRAVWVPYMSLDMSREADRSETAFLRKFDSIIQVAKSCGMNTLVVQVRPFGDALYPSEYFPWSHTVGGTQGVDPRYDPLKDMVDACHKAGLSIHAWVNPLRIQTAGTPSILAAGNPYNKFRQDATKADFVVDCAKGKYYNPAYEEVRKLIADGVREIAKKYDVDGIQFDDYFYPVPDASFDQKAYAAYCASAKKTGTPLALGDWRRGNVSALVSLVYRSVKAVRPDLPFGIAPQGNVRNDLGMGADVASWCSARGYVDYICPQLYYNFENPTLPYDAAAETWRRLVTNPEVKLYFGLAAYKAGSDADSGTWKKSTNILASQVEYGRKISCDGFMFYSCDSLKGEQTKQEVQNVVKLLR